MKDALAIDVVLATAAAAAVLPSRFVDSFCDAASFEGDFHNWLGGLTPCFADVVVLGEPSPSVSCTSACSAGAVR